MKRTHNQLVDSDDDVDTLPLAYISSDNNKYITLKELKRYSLHTCDFCEKKFKNSYDHLVHNAKHIIIPLMKTLPYYCAECGLYHISEEAMNKHIFAKHNTSNSKSINCNNDDIKEPDKCKFEVENIKEESNEDDKPLNCFIKKEKETQLVQNNPENILQNFMMSCKVDVEKFVPTWQYQSDNDDNKSNIVNIQKDVKNLADFEPYKNVNDIIKNEVSYRNDRVQLRLSTEDNSIIKSEVDDIDNPVAEPDCLSDLSGLDEDPIILLPIKKEIVNECCTVNDSIHFEDLIKPGMFYCKRCFKRFPNRYEVIIHEVVHLDLSKAAPVNYKRKHKKPAVEAVSPPKISKEMTKCNRCNEEILDRDTHENTCLNVHCPACAKAFNNGTALKAHEDKCNGEAVVNMCDECLYLRKRPKHIRYCAIVRFADLEEKRVCHWCGRVCDRISVVTLVSNQRFADRIRFESDVGGQHSKEVMLRTTNTRKRAKRGSKILSKWERLKLIQNRLKSMKK